MAEKRAYRALHQAGFDAGRSDGCAEALAQSQSAAIAYLARHGDAKVSVMLRDCCGFVTKWLATIHRARARAKCSEADSLRCVSTLTGAALNRRPSARLSEQGCLRNLATCASRSRCAEGDRSRADSPAARHLTLQRPPAPIGPLVAFALVYARGDTAH